MPARHPVLGRSYAAYPVLGSVPQWVNDLQASQLYIWNAVAIQLQHELGVIRDAYNAIAERKKGWVAGGLDEKHAEQQAKAERDSVDWSRVNALKKELPRVFKLAQSEPSDGDTPFALMLRSKLHAEQLRDIEKRLVRVIRTKREGKGWDEGYPQLKRDAADLPLSLSLHFAGRNLELDWNDPASHARNSYVEIGPVYDPADHHGRRGVTGNRTKRQMRVVTFILAGASGTRRIKEGETDDRLTLALNVLVHDPDRLNRTVKAASVHCDQGEWSVSFVLESSLPEPRIEAAKRTYVGVDIGWRQTHGDSVAILHYGGEDGPAVTQPIGLPPSRAAKRLWESRSKPLGMNPYGEPGTNPREALREFQREIDNKNMHHTPDRRRLLPPP